MKRFPTPPACSQLSFAGLISRCFRAVGPHEYSAAYTRFSNGAVHQRHGGPLSEKNRPELSVKKKKTTYQSLMFLSENIIDFVIDELIFRFFFLFYNLSVKLYVLGVFVRPFNLHTY